MSVTPCPHLFFIGLKFGPGLYQLPPINITETRIGPALGLRGSRPSCHCRRDLRPPLRPPEDSPHPSGHLQESPAVFWVSAAMPEMGWFIDVYSRVIATMNQDDIDDIEKPPRRGHTVVRSTIFFCI